MSTNQTHLGNLMSSYNSQTGASFSNSVSPASTHGSFAANFIGSQQPKQPRRVQTVQNTDQQTSMINQNAPQSTGASIAEMINRYKPQQSTPVQQLQAPLPQTNLSMGMNMVSMWAAKGGPKTAEGIAETMRVEIISTPLPTLIIAIRRFKSIGLGGPKATEVMNASYAKAVANIKKAKGANFNAERDLRIPNQYLADAKLVKEGLGDKLYAINPQANFDHLAIILHSELKDMFNAAQTIRPMHPDFLYSKAYCAAVSFDAAYESMYARLTFSRDLLYLANELGIQGLVETIQRVCTGREAEFQTVPMSQYNSLNADDKLCAMVFGSYVIDFKFLSQTKDVKTSKNTARHSKYKVKIATTYMTVIKLWDQLFNGVRSEQFTDPTTFSLSPKAIFSITYWACLNDIQLALRTIKNNALGRRQGVASANADALDSFTADEFNSVMTVKYDFAKLTGGVRGNLGTQVDVSRPELGGYNNKPFNKSAAMGQVSEHMASKFGLSTPTLSQGIFSPQQFRQQQPELIMKKTSFAPVDDDSDEDGDVEDGENLPTGEDQSNVKQE